MRHTFATALVRANVNPAVLKALMRHSHLRTTLRYYVDVDEDMRREAVEALT